VRIPESINLVAKRLARAQLNETEDAVRKAILRAFASSGTSPTAHDIVTLLPKLSHLEVTLVCHRLAEHDLIIWEEKEQRIKSAYPFSGLPTPHAVHIKSGPTVFALCAVDALGMPVMLGHSADIVSRCAYCHTPVEVAVTPQGLSRYTPKESLVWFPLTAEACSPMAESRCPDINFFCATGHLDSWGQASGWPEGLSMTMTEAFEAGREIFGLLLAPAESAT
jgi:hypothetical protein